MAAEGEVAAKAADAKMAAKGGVAAKAADAAEAAEGDGSGCSKSSRCSRDSRGGD